MAVHAEAINQRARSTEREKSRRRERIFFTGMSIAFFITVFAGFSRTYFLRPYFNPQPLMPLLHLHGIVFSAWLLLLLAQTTLVAANRTEFTEGSAWPEQFLLP